MISRTWVSGLLNRIREPGLIFTVIRIMANIVKMNFYYKIKKRIREPGLIFTVIRIMANIVKMNFYYKISFNTYMDKSNFT